MFARALIVLLLVLNLGVAAWWLLRDAPPEPARTASAADVPSLRLVSELPAVERARMLASPAGEAQATSAQEPVANTQDGTGADGATTPTRCHAFGPFTDANAAQAAGIVLAGAGRRLSTRREAGRSGSHWDVRMPAQADRAAAQALAARIDAAGFKDYYVIATGAAANSIALGRFGDEDTALRHQAALRAAGFAALVDSPEQPVRWWLDLDLDRAASGDFDAQAARSRVGAGEVLERACVAPG
jgi:hypothetical protein